MRWRRSATRTSIGKFGLRYAGCGSWARLEARSEPKSRTRTELRKARIKALLIATISNPFRKGSRNGQRYHARPEKRSARKASGVWVWKMPMGGRSLVD